MYRFKVSLILLLFSLCYTIKNAEAECRSHRPFAIIQYSVSSTEYIKTDNSDSLTLMHDGVIGASKVLGLAGGDVGTSFDALFDIEQQKDGLYCLYVKKVKATFFAHPKVYIASNFKKGTCEYANVLRHEEKHVKVLKRTHRQYMPEFKRHLRKTTKNLPILQPMTLNEVNDKKQFLVKQISKDLSSYMQVITLEVAKRQSKIDTKKEYQRVMSRCTKWDKRLAVNP